MNADKTNPVRLTNTENVTDTQIQFADEGKTIVFVRKKNDGSRTSLMKISIDGGDAQPLFSESQFSEFGPKISPDGKRLAYYSFLYDNQTSDMKRSVKVVGMDGEKVADSAENIELNISPEFKWSPDGKFLTYIDRSGVDNLWNISLADKKEKPLTEFSSSNITNFTWSRDGKKIFILRGLVNGDLVLIKDGSNSRLS